MIEDFLIRNEGKTLEFKENTKNLKSILKTVVAFANTSGGTIVIGVQDKTKEVVGVLDPLEDEEKLANAISDSIEPLIMPVIEICVFRNKQLLIIRVPHLPGPYHLNKKGESADVYVRFGSTNRLADTEAIHSLKLLAANKTYDELPSFKGAVNEEYLRLVFQNVGKGPTKKQCNMLGIYTDHFGKVMPTIGGILLFCDEHAYIYPDSMIRCACFEGRTKEKIIDYVDLYTPLPSAVEEIINFIKKNTRREAQIGSIRRAEVLEYPPQAIREIVINALVHADYSMKGSHIQVAIFSDRIEITNPGCLPYGQTMKKALSGYSRLRNHVIGRVFRELELIEQWGSGLKRIKEVCRKRGLKDPLFQEEGNHFRSTIYSIKTNRTDLASYEQKLVDYLHKHKSAQTQQVAKLWNITDRAARARLSKMIQEGIVVRISTSPKDPLAVFALQEEL